VKEKLKSTFLLKKLSSLLMYNGKKKLIFKSVLKSLQNFHPIKKNICILTTMFYRIKPILETRKVRKGSKFYDVPFLMKKSRAFSIMLRWFVKAIRKNQNLKFKALSLGITNEFKDVVSRTGFTVKESKNLRTKVASNIMFSHFRWK
jgi:small subunit ribosomal protein S7